MSGMCASTLNEYATSTDAVAIGSSVADACATASPRARGLREHAGREVDAARAPRANRATRSRISPVPQPTSSTSLPVA